HDQEGDEAADGIAQQHGRPGALHNACGPQEQAGTDGTAQGTQLNVAIGQAAFKLALLGGDGPCWLGHSGIPWRRGTALGLYIDWRAVTDVGQSDMRHYNAALKKNALAGCRRYGRGNKTMFNHVMIGSNDIERSKRFYDAVLGLL